VTYATCALHCASYSLLFLSLPDRENRLLTYLLILVVMVWVTWASDAMAFLLKRMGQHLGNLNQALRENQAHLEARIAERTLQLQEAQALVLHQEKMAALGLLAAGVAHEVGNPLTAISSMVQMLQRRDLDEYTQDKLALVNGQLKRIQNTLRELINFSRPISTEKAPVSVKEVIEEALNIVKYYKGTRERRLEMTVSPELPAVHSKRDWLVQAVLNLVLNAIDATDKGGSIRLCAEGETDQVRIRVQDNGTGIKEEDLPRLFQPYFTTKKHGTGLGLFVTQKLVAEHGGRVTCDSAPGQGTTFTIDLPVEKPPLASGSIVLDQASGVREIPSVLPGAGNSRGGV
jgi:signal transduction histidine kinase